MGSEDHRIWIQDSGFRVQSVWFKAFLALFALQSIKPKPNVLRPHSGACAASQNQNKWVVVNIRVPFWVP